jgi:beta-ketoacyl-acyl-carrier-protein synthase II
MELTRNGTPRVVITGIGVLSPLGLLPAYWNGLVEGRSGIRRIQLTNVEHVPVKIAGEVDFDPAAYLNHREARRMSRAAQMAQIAARLACEDAGLSAESLAAIADRVGVAMGTVIAGFEMLLEATLHYRNEGRKPNPVHLVNGLPNMPGHYISIETGATGPLTTISTACASSTQAIGEGLDWIRTGRSDVVIAGGVDCLLFDVVLAAFHAMTVLADGYNDRPEAACRPFDANRCGFVMSEGAAVVVLETLERAAARNAPVYAEVLGHAASSDAFHSAAIDIEGKGAQRAMRWALLDAHVDPDSVSYINAHGPGTRSNDPIETLAIKRVFGQRAYQVPISSTKSMIGHAMGAAGALEAVACIKSITDGVIHPTINLEQPDPECDLDYVPNEARDHEVKIVLSNSFGLGGQNACLVLGRI